MATVTKRNGAYQITVSCGYDIHGKHLRESTTFRPDPAMTPKKQQKALEAFVAEFEAKVKNGVLLDGRKTTLKDFSERWLNEYAIPKLQPGTVVKYKQELQDKILPALGHMVLTNIKPYTINSFLLSLAQNGARKDGKTGGYSKGSISKTSTVLSSLFRTAVEWEIIDHNPCENVRTYGENTADKLRFFTPEQTALFLDYIEQPYYVPVKGHSRTDDTGLVYDVGDYQISKQIPEQIRVLFILAFFTGLRKGEILALQWSDFDFENGTVEVSKAVTVVDGKVIIKKPKTRTSHRSISIPWFLVTRLQKLKNSQEAYRNSVGDYWQGDQWVFIQDNGKMMNYSTPYAALQDAIDRYNQGRQECEQLPKIPFHGIRHTSATLLIASHQDIRTVSSRMGHAQASTTMNIYAHQLKENDRSAANALENMLKKAQT